MEEEGNKIESFEEGEILSDSNGGDDESGDLKDVDTNITDLVLVRNVLEKTTKFRHALVTQHN